MISAKSDETSVERRKLRNSELQLPYATHDIISIIKSRRLRWARLGVEGFGRRRNRMGRDLHEAEAKIRR